MARQARKRKPMPRPAAIVRREVPTLAEAIEKVLIGGDLTPLSVDQRLEYYKKVCSSLGLNSLTHPFAYIVFNDPPKMVLYATRDCTDQLRKLHGISVTNVKRTVEDGMLIAEAEVRDREGKVDSAIGVLPTSRWNKWAKPQPCVEELKGLDLANARMKVETKAKRRATLSICGLGFLDVSELDTIDYSEVTASGRIIQEICRDPAQGVAQQKLAAHAQGKTIDVTAEPETLPETIIMTPWKDGRLSLTGNGLAIVKAEIEPQELADLDIKLNVKERITHLPETNAFKFQDRAAKAGVVAKFAESSPA